MYTAVCVTALLVALSGAQHPSPCPAVFRYIEKSPAVPGQWTGEIVLETDFPLSGVWVRFLLDRKIEKVESSFGSVVPREDKSHLIKSREYNLIPGSPLHIPVVVSYPVDQPAPSVVGVRLNGRVVCPAPTTAPPTTQCPGVFQHSKDSEEAGRWHGVLTLTSEFEIHGVWLKVVLDHPAELLGSREYNLVPGSPLHIPVVVSYPVDQPAPSVVGVRLNGRVVCPAPTTAPPTTQCPGVFQHSKDSEEAGRWHGVLTLTSEFEIHGVWLKVVLDHPAELLGSREYNLVPGSPLHIPVVVSYPVDQPAPSVVGVRLNGRVVCPAPTTAPPTTQCPGVFQHSKDSEEAGRWHGVLTLTSEFEIHGVWLKVVLDHPAELLGNEFGEVRTDDNLSYLIANRNHTLLPERPLRLQFWVKYDPKGPVPNIHTVRLNGRTVCGQIISEDNNQHVIYFALLDRFASRVSSLPPRRHTPITTLPPLHNTPHSQPIFPPFNPATTPSTATLAPPTTTPSTATLAPPTTSPTTTPSTATLAPPTTSPTTTPSTATPAPPTTSPTTTPSTATPAPPTTSPTTSQQPQHQSASLDTSGNQFISCGTVELEKVDLITFGERARSAQWPWHGAIYLVKPRALDYICGMSLISEKHALTAAHCVLESITTKKLRDVKSIKLYFGLLNRTDFDAPSVQNPTVNSIIVHDDYKVSESDIAVIKFNNKVKFTEFVRPVCLWEGDTEQRLTQPLPGAAITDKGNCSWVIQQAPAGLIVNQTGTVVGFGVTQSGAISQELMYANILVVDTPTCIFSHRDFYSRYTSLNTFCAGNLTQSAVCNGDSGGAMVFRREGSDVWQVRGLVSTAVRNVDTGLCDYNYYAIFTDAAKFTSWIEAAMTR